MPARVSVLGGRDPDHDVRVASGRDHALVRIQAEDAGRRLTRNLDQPLRCQRMVAAQREPDRQPGSDAGHAGRHAPEVAQRRQLVTVEPQVAVIGRQGVQAAVAERVQQRGAVGG